MSRRVMCHYHSLANTKLRPVATKKVLSGRINWDTCSSIRLIFRTLKSARLAVSPCYTNHHLPAHLYNAQTRQWKFFSPNSQPRKCKANYTKTVPSVINRLKSCDKTKYILTLIAMYVKVGLNHPGGMMAGENWNHFFVLPKIFINSYCCGDVMKPRTHFPVWWLLNTTFHRNNRLPVR